MSKIGEDVACRLGHVHYVGRGHIGFSQDVDEIFKKVSFWSKFRFGREIRIPMVSSVFGNSK